MFYTPIKVVYLWIRETLTRLHQKTNARFQEPK